MPFAGPNFDDLAARNRSFEALASYGLGPEAIAGGTEPIRTNACAAVISKALGDAKPEEAQDIDLSTLRRESNSSTGGRNINVQDGPKIGTTPYFVLQAVTRKPGMSGAEVVAAVQVAGHTVAEPQIRTALSRLEKRSPPLIVNRHRKWFPV